MSHLPPTTHIAAVDPCLHKGHKEGGACFSNKIKAHKFMDDNPTITHVDPSVPYGVSQMHVDTYDSAVRFIKYIAG